jgi:predicted acylesterase/phospholipase RssA
MRVATAFLLIAFARPSAEARDVAASNRPSDVVHLRIGVIPFDDPLKSKEALDTETSLRAYFDNVAGNTGRPRIEVTTVRGNYYQIHQWMRSGDLDGAVVSAFTAFLLTRDHAVAVYPAAEFLRPGDDAAVTAPALVVGRKGTEQLADPLIALNACLRAIKASLADPGVPQQCEFQFVNHLSTTGFVLPLLYFDSFVNRQKPPLTTEQEKAFWNRLLEWSRMAMWHDADLPLRMDIPTFSFSYNNAERPGVPLPLKEKIASLPDVLLLGCKRAIPARPAPDDANRRVAVCNEHGPYVDTMLPPSSTAGGLPNNHSIWISAGEAMVAVNDATHGSPDKYKGYVAARPWSEKARNEFAGTMEHLFDDMKADTPLGELYQRWYQENKYSFRIDEVIDLLIHDQRIRPDAQRAALVLPGGGVRATYQAVILDSLYGTTIANAGDPSYKPNTGPPRLLITTIAGTSGGALLGYFASRRNSIPSDYLTREWIDCASVKTRPGDIFPFFDIFRWLSVLVVIGIFAVTAAIHLRWLTILPLRQVPFWYTASSTALLTAAPFLIWRNALRDPAFEPKYERAAFLIVVLAAHFLHSVSIPVDGIASRRRWRLGILMMTLAVLLSAYLSTSTRVPDQWWPAVSAITVLFAIAGLATTVAGAGTRPRRELVRAYAQGMAVLAIVIAIAAVIFAIGVFSGDVTTLEMTVQYWVWVFIAGVVGAKLVVVAGRLYPSSPLQGGTQFLSTPSGTIPFPYTPAVTLVFWSVLGLAAWLVFIAPALYSSTTAKTFFAAARKRHDTEKELAPLLVSMTAFGTDIKGYKSYYHDYYACTNCGTVDPTIASTSARILPPMPADNFSDAVFASGSPFPIFPAAKVQAEQKENPGLFLDGGYAHRVPIEAARIANASQILVVENIARREDSAATDLHAHRTGALAANLGKSFDFLFDRSQGVDVEAEKSAVVAAIYPDWIEDDPFLMDFRESVVRALAVEARRDLDRHRVAMVTSWGAPPARER